MRDQGAWRASRRLVALLVVVVTWVSLAASVTAAPAPDRSTPRRSVTGFLRALDRDDAKGAATYLQIDGATRRHIDPPTAAAQLGRVLAERVWIVPSELSDEPEGDLADGADIERIGFVDVDDMRISITLARVSTRGEPQWLFSAATVARIPDLARSLETTSWLVDFVPEAWRDTRIAGLWSWQWFGLLLAIAGGLPVGYVVGRFVTWILGRIARETPVDWDDALVAKTRAGLRFAFAWLAMGALAASLDLPQSLDRWVEIGARTPLILATGWILRQAVFAITGVYLERTRDDTNLDRRGLRTQIVILRRLSTVAILLVTLGVVMMQFDIVRSVGVSLLASAGVAGIALGIGAQKSLGDLIAGLQLSITQPVRLGDTVVLRGEVGTIEEIKLTFVRVKLWDERRLIVPIETFLTEIYENWSVPGDELMGVVTLPVDPTAPVPVIRAELQRLAAEHPAHDGRACVVQVTELDERRAIIRARISTSDPSQAFAMRCEVREAMMDFLQGLEGGRYLVRQRWAEVS